MAGGFTSYHRTNLALSAFLFSVGSLVIYIFIRAGTAKNTKIIKKIANQLTRTMIIINAGINVALRGRAFSFIS